MASTTLPYGTMPTIVRHAMPGRGGGGDRRGKRNRANPAQDNDRNRVKLIVRRFANLEPRPPRAFPPCHRRHNAPFRLL